MRCEAKHATNVVNSCWQMICESHFGRFWGETMPFRVSESSNDIESGLRWELAHGLCYSALQESPQVLYEKEVANGIVLRLSSSLNHSECHSKREINQPNIQKLKSHVKTNFRTTRSARTGSQGRFPPEPVGEGGNDRTAPINDLGE